MIDTSTDALFESIEIDGPELGPTGRPLPDLPEPQPPQGTGRALIIAMCNQKGGVGKSTKARALAREASACGIKTKLADLDLEQATSAEWHRRRLSAGLPPVASVEVFSTAKQAIESAGEFDLLILDGPARASKGTSEIAKVADLIVQPTGASLDDLVPAIKVFNALVKEGVPRSKLVDRKSVV